MKERQRVQRRQVVDRSPPKQKLTIVISYKNTCRRFLFKFEISFIFPFKHLYGAPCLSSSSMDVCEDRRLTPSIHCWHAISRTKRIGYKYACTRIPPHTHIHVFVYRIQILKTLAFITSPLKIVIANKYCVRQAGTQRWYFVENTGVSSCRQREADSKEQ